MMRGMTDPEGDPTLLLQLSDLHLRVEEGAEDRRLAHALAVAAELQPRPSAVLLTGDVADEPAFEVYERAHRMIASLGLPIHAIPGNHDDRDLLAMTFAGREGATGAPVHVLTYVGPLRLIGCDTTVPGSPGGALGPDQLRWLDRTLSDEPARPTLLALHHPPIAVGLVAMDEMGLDAADAARLESLLEAHPQVQAITCGHVHRTAMTTFAGRPVLLCPSTNSTLRLDLRAEEGLPLKFDEQPLGFAVHALRDGRLVSHVQGLEAS
jgi:3',5'-cyclic AMP phosphodiesterase CpdA